MIPRVVHRIWLDGDEPEWTRDFAATWERPGWTVKEWSAESLLDFLSPLGNQGLYDLAPRIVPGHEDQFRSDILRYELLYAVGGVYVDTDFECVRGIDRLIEDLNCFVAWEKQGVWLNNAIMGARPGHEFMSELIHQLRYHVGQRRGRGVRPNVLSGPQYLTRIWKRTPYDCATFPQSMFYPYAYDELDRHEESFPNAYAIHHWANQRRLRGVPLESRGIDPARSMR